MASPKEKMQSLTNGRETIDTKASDEQVQTNLRVISDAVINEPIYNSTDDFIFSYPGETLTLNAIIETTGNILICATNVHINAQLNCNNFWYMKGITVLTGKGKISSKTSKHFGYSHKKFDLEKIKSDFHQIRHEDRKILQDTVYSIYTVDSLSDVQKKLILERGGVILSNSAATAANTPVRFKIAALHLNSVEAGGIRELLGLKRTLFNVLSEQAEKQLRVLIPSITFEVHPQEPTKMLATYQIQYAKIIDNYISKNESDDLELAWEITYTNKTVKFKDYPNEPCAATLYSIQASGPTGTTMPIYAKNHFSTDAGSLVVSLKKPDNPEARTIFKLEKTTGHVFFSINSNGDDASKLTAEVIVCRTPKKYPNNHKGENYSNFTGSLTTSDRADKPATVRCHSPEPESINNNPETANTATATLPQPATLAPAASAAVTTDAEAINLANQTITESVRILQPEFEKITKEAQWKQQIKLILDAMEVEANPPTYPTLDSKLARAATILGLLNQETLPLDRILIQTDLCETEIVAREAQQKQSEQPQSGAPILHLLTAPASKTNATTKVTTANALKPKTDF